MSMTTASAILVVAVGACLLLATSPETRRLHPAFEPPGQTYNYAPCVVAESGASRVHIWYCGNRESGKVTDYLCYRSGRWNGSGWKWTEERVAFAPSQDRSAWDSRHVCDPEVVMGRFRYRGTTWRYAMLYLGSDAELSTHNQMGVAFAKALQGPWIRYPHPIIRYTGAPVGGVVSHHLGWPVYKFWGVGQPAAVSLDRRSRLRVFFTRGEEVFRQETVVVDFSDMDRGPQVSDRQTVSTAGLRQRNGQPLEALTNVGVAVDEGRDLIYMVREGLPPDDGKHPNFISNYVQVAVASWSEVQEGGGTWRVLGEIDGSKTGWPRNHNAALLRDWYGRVLPRWELVVALSVAEAYDEVPPDFGWLWTYRVVLTPFPLPNTR